MEWRQLVNSLNNRYIFAILAPCLWEDNAGCVISAIAPYNSDRVVGVISNMDGQEWSGGA